MKLITKENCFISKRNNSSISDYKECLDKFSVNFEKEISLKTSTPIFLDTNVLLRYYSISFTAREKLFDFIKQNNSRIILTSQVQLEYIKNREDVIQRFFEQVTNKIPKDFNSDVVNKMNGFLDQHKIVLKDYPFVETGIKNHKDDLEKLLQKLNETIELKRKEQNNLIVNDKFLDLLNTCTLYQALTIDELDLIKKDFDVLAKTISTETIDSILSNKPNSIFPGLGDIKNKPDNPYGDYIIFHEIMKYMMNKKTDAVFLTFDNSKGDWMNKNKSPFLHYIQNIYNNTSQMLYIIDAERTLGDILNVNIESLVASETIGSTDITVESITKLFRTNKIFFGAKIIEIGPETISELIINGYNSIEQIEKDLLRCEVAVKTYQEEHELNLNAIGILRVSLRIANTSYKTTVFPNGNSKEMSESDYKKYRSYGHLLQK